MRLALIALFGACNVVFPLEGPPNTTTQIAAGRNHTCRLDGEGRVFCWGRGALGGVDQRDTITLAQTEIPLSARATAIGAGDGFSCALLADKSVSCWGRGDSGRLGDGRGVDDVPVRVALPGAARELAVGLAHACARLDDGVACWGLDSSGQAAVVDLENALSPVVVPGSTGATAIGAGENHACFVLDGVPSCWGSDSSGQLGFAPPADPAMPTPTPTAIIGFDAVDRIVGGEQHTCVLQDNGDVRCIGDNKGGELGRAANNIDPMPGAASATGVEDVGTGSRFVCVVTSDHGVRCWGDGRAGERGDGVFQSSDSAVDILASDTGVAGIGLGYHHGCAIERDQVVCWGNDVFGELGRGTRAITSTPAEVTLPAKPAMVAMSGSTDLGTGHTCALIGGDVYCWGLNDQGQLGDGTRIGRPTPTKVTTSLNPALGVATGGSHTCAWGASEIKCWGSNTFGQLGDNTFGDATSPVSVVLGAPTPITTVALGRSHSCALTGNGVICWGANNQGQLGVGSGPPSSLPKSVQVPVPVSTLGVGDSHSCAIKPNGDLFCWGANDDGQIDSSFLDHNAPVLVAIPALASGHAPALGKGHTCYITAANDVLCWGRNLHGELGIGTTVSTPTPSQVEIGSPATRVTAGDRGTCALLGTGEVKCWGAGLVGELGDGTDTPIATTPVSTGIASALEIARGGDGGCALLADKMVCWGNDTGGKLALGIGITAAMPQPIVDPP